MVAYLNAEAGRRVGQHNVNICDLLRQLNHTLVDFDPFFDRAEVAAAMVAQTASEAQLLRYQGMLDWMQLVQGVSASIRCRMTHMTQVRQENERAKDQVLARVPRSS